jgi:hypothetical protein
MTLNDLWPQISEEAKSKECAGVVIVLVTDGAPLVIRTMADELMRPVLRTIIEADAQDAGPQ